MFFLPVYHSNGWLISLFCQPAHLFNFLKYFLHSQLYSFAFHLIYAAAAAAAKSLQSCPTLCDPIDGSSPGSPIPGILQARTLEWVAISFSNAWKWKVKVKSLSCVQLLATPWTAAHQAPPSMGFFQARVLEWGAIAFSTSYIHIHIHIYSVLEAFCRTIELFCLIFCVGLSTLCFHKEWLTPCGSSIYMLKFVY